MDAANPWSDTSPAEDVKAGSLPRPGFQASAYPRRYRRSALSRAVSGAAVLALVVVCVLAFMLAAQGYAGARVSPAWLAALGTAAAGAATALARQALRSQVLLLADAIEVHHWRGVHRATVADLAGRRRVPDSTHVSSWRLVLQPGRGAPFDTPAGLVPDPPWDLWFQRLPDLDRQDRTASARRLNERHGADTGQALRWMDRWQVANRGAAAVLASLTAYSMSSAPGARAVLLVPAVLPWLILWLVRRSGGRLRMDRATTDLRPSALGLFGLCGVLLWPRLLTDANLADPLDAMAKALLVAGAGGWLLYRVVRRWPNIGQDRLWLLAPLTAVLLAACGLWLNQWADPGATRIQRAAHSLKHPGTVHHQVMQLRIEPWLPNQGERHLRVAPAVYRAVSPGETVCLHLHPGRLGLAWYEVRACDVAPVPADSRWTPVLHRALQLASFLNGATAHLPQRLREGRWQEVQDELAQLQQAYEKGQVDGEALRDAYWVFFDPDPRLDQPLDRWVQAQPQSYAAKLARALHLKYQSWTLEMAGMQPWAGLQFNHLQAVHRVEEDLLAATRLARQPTLAYQNLLDVAVWHDDRRRFDDAVAQALARDPDNLAFHRKVLGLLGRMRNAGLPAMRAHVLQVRERGAPAVLVGQLEAFVTLTEGNWALGAGRADEAQALFQRAIALKPWKSDLAHALSQSAYVLQGQQRFDAVINLAQQALVHDERHGLAHARLGHALEHQGQIARAAASYRQGAELDEPYCQANLGRLLLSGHLGAPQREQATLWLNRAARQGEPYALQMLRADPSLRLLP